MHDRRVRARRRARYVALALALALLPSIVAMRSTEPTIDADVIANQPRWVTDALAAFARRRAACIGRRGSARHPMASLADAIDTLAGTSAARWGIGAARSDDPARQPEEAAAFAASSHGGGQLLERFGVGLAVLPRSVVESRHMRELDRRDDWALAQYPAEPPAITVSDWEWASDSAAAFKTVFPPDGSRGVPLDRGVLIGSGPAPDAGGVHHATTCTIARWDPGAIDSACGPPSNAYAIASSSATAGWTVDVDGTPRHGSPQMRFAVRCTSPPASTSCTGAITCRACRRARAGRAGHAR